MDAAVIEPFHSYTNHENLVKIGPVLSEITFHKSTTKKRKKEKKTLE